MAGMLLADARDPNKLTMRAGNGTKHRLNGTSRVATILPFLRDPSVFEPEAVQAMSKAFDDACRALKLAPGAAQERETLAIRIIELARQGERNPKRLCERVVRDVGAD